MKLMKVLVAVLVMAGIALPAVAEDKLSISGEFYVMGFMQSNYSDFDSNDDADKVNYFKQRLRLYSKYAVTEGVTIHTRMDFGEEAWGNEGQNSVRYDETDTEWQLDRAFVEIVKGPWNLRAGQQYYGFGNSIAVDHQGTGFTLAYGGPVKVTAFWNKFNENGSKSDKEFEVITPAVAPFYYLDPADGLVKLNPGSAQVVSEVDRADQDLYGVSLKYKNDAFAGELFYAIDDNKSTDAEKSVIGLAASTKLGAVNLSGEFNYYDGDNGGAVDYKGTQLYVDANTALTDAFTLGGKLFYAKGYDDAVQISELTDFGSILPEEYGYLETDFGLLSAGSVFNPWATNAGTESLMVYGSYKASDALGFMASVQYAQEEESDVADYEAMSYNLSTQYTIAKNTFLQLQANFLDVDSKYDDFDSAKGLAAKLLAKF